MPQTPIRAPISGAMYGGIFYSTGTVLDYRCFFTTGPTLHAGRNAHSVDDYCHVTAKLLSKQFSAKKEANSVSEWRLMKKAKKLERATKA